MSYRVFLETRQFIGNPPGPNKISLKSLITSLPYTEHLFGQ